MVCNSLARSHCRLVCNGCYLMATHGVNRIVVTYPPLLKQLYGSTVTRATVYGRLINDNHIVNVKVNYTHDDKVRASLDVPECCCSCGELCLNLKKPRCLQLNGYVCEIDLRDPGEYTLQVRMLQVTCVCSVVIQVVTVIDGLDPSLSMLRWLCSLVCLGSTDISSNP